MAIKRQYFTYITNIVTSSDYPGGAYEHPNNFSNDNIASITSRLSTAKHSAAGFEN